MSTGWGRLTWGQADWDGSTTITEGWGRLAYGAQPWGDSPQFTITGVSATASIEQTLIVDKV